MTLVLAAQAFATLMMVGVIWMCQIVHYPLFEELGSGLPAYQQRNVQRTTVVVIAPMFVEAATAAAVLVWPPDGVPRWTAVVGAAILAVIWASTFALQVPLHARLGERFDPTVLRRLLRTNWIRTVGWTARGALVLWMLVAALG